MYSSSEDLSGKIQFVRIEYSNRIGAKGNLSQRIDPTGHLNQVCGCKYFHNKEKRVSQKIGEMETN